jgi:hypothetical protein
MVFDNIIQRLLTSICSECKARRKSSEVAEMVVNNEPKSFEPKELLEEEHYGLMRKQLQDQQESLQARKTHKRSPLIPY